MPLTMFSKKVTVRNVGVIDVCFKVWIELKPRADINNCMAVVATGSLLIIKLIQYRKKIL